MEPPPELVAFCEREHPRLVGALTLYCGERAAAEELAQEALAAACERWERVGRMERPGAWVHRVAVNAAHSRFRRRAAGRRAQQRLEQRHEVVAHDPDAADAVAIRREVARLPSRQAQALVLRHYLGLSVVETAAWMEVTEAAVKSLNQRALVTLRAALGELVPADRQEADDVWQ